MGGLVVICIAFIIALLGYFILPDSSPDASNSIPVLQKKPPGYSVKLIKVKRQLYAPKAGLVEKWLSGANPEYKEIPVERFTVDGANAIIQPVSRLAMPDSQIISIPLSELLAKKGIFTSLTNQSPAKKAGLAPHDFVFERTYWLGTDKAGRDVLSRLLLGTRISLAVGLLAVLLSVTVGVTAGALAGFFGGVTDKIIQWLMTVIWSVPGIILVIAISLALQQKGIGVLFIAIGLTTWVEVARLVRGEMMALRQMTFVEAATALGLPKHRILVRHMLPNLLGPIIVVATANFASAILMEAGLSFLGLGVQPPAPSWGMMVAEGFQLLGSTASWYLVLWPSVSICLLVMALNLVGNGLRDAFDPRTLVLK